MKIGRFHIRAIALASAATIAASPASAVICEGTVVSVATEASAYVGVDFGFGNNLICSLSSTVQKDTGNAYGVVSVTPEYCQALFSSFLTAKASRGTIRFYYDLTTCPVEQTLPKWPYAIQFIN